MSNSVAHNISSLLLSIENCQRSGNTEWQHKHRMRIEAIMANYAPSGSGIDCGVKLLPQSTPECLIFSADFHHMDESGSYDGWTEHCVKVTASLAFGLNIRVTGRDRNDIKSYLAEIFDDFLNTKVLDCAIDLKYKQMVGE